MAPREVDQQLKTGEEVSAIDRLEPPKPVAPPDAGAEEDVQEVEVKGEKPPREVTKRTLEQREINRIPGTGGDALRSLQNLPGVARTPGFAGRSSCAGRPRTTPSISSTVRRCPRSTTSAVSPRSFRRSWSTGSTSTPGTSARSTAERWARSSTSASPARSREKQAPRDGRGANPGRR